MKISHIENGKALAASKSSVVFFWANGVDNIIYKW
jgi:hypothetical protein